VCHGAGRHSGDLCDFSVRHPLEFAKNEYFAKIQWELFTLALQSKVAGAIADQIRINVNPQEQAALKTVRVVNPQAYESYLKGL
jgi:hypothetical protein